MNYIESAVNPARILNHLPLIKAKCKELRKDSLAKLDSKKFVQSAHVELQLTDLCNLSCDHCHFRKQGDVHFKFEWINIIKEKIHPVAISLIGGGEPTCYPLFAKAVKELTQDNHNCKIGLITNGVYIPQGDWFKALSWIRISLYTIINGKYSGKNEALYSNVLSNIKWYLTNTNIKNIGVSFLLFRESIDSVGKNIEDLFYILTKDNCCIERMNIQFKFAFMMARPRLLSKQLHEENKYFLPTVEQIKIAIDQINNIGERHPEIGRFIEKKSNFYLLYSFLERKLQEAIDVTDPSIPLISQQIYCYYCLAFMLITPKGYIFPCATIAEFRESQDSLCHITDLSLIDRNIKKFYKSRADCCNKRFCRYIYHNDIISKNINSLSIDNNFPTDPFF